MALYEYSIDDQNAQQVEVVIRTKGQARVARAVIMRGMGSPDFETYAVEERFRGKGFSYALTYLMLLYCQHKGIQLVTVNNAHGELIGALEQVGFAVVGAKRYDPKAKQNAASLQCINIAQALKPGKDKLVRKGLIAEGFRNVGPVQF